MRSRVRGVLVDNFFTHRYDYRREWMRCIETLTAPDAFIGLHKRAIRAVAEVVDSPAGVLFVRAPEDVAFQWAGSLNTPAVTAPIPPGHPLVPAFADGDRIAVLEELPDAAAWFEEIPRAWLAVPLNHFGNLIGFVVLTRSRAPFKLDHEVFQLLRVVGREVASRVAEQRAAQILSQTRELRDYSQRFAFVLHDIKNVSGQLSMLLANAEVHADNPEFQRDMLATVRASVGKITRLLPGCRPTGEERSHALIDPVERLKDIVEGTPNVRLAGAESASTGAPTGAPTVPPLVPPLAPRLKPPRVPRPAWPGPAAGPSSRSSDCPRTVALPTNSDGVAIDAGIVRRGRRAFAEQCGRGIAVRCAGPRRCAARGSEHGHRHHRRRTGHDPGIRSR